MGAFDEAVTDRGSSALTLVAGGCPNSGDNNHGYENANFTPKLLAFNVDIAIENESTNHVPAGSDVTYRSNPPASGPHWPTPAQPGSYPNGVATEQWIHYLEHGYAVSLYHCRGTCDANLLESLQEFSQSGPASSILGYAKIVVPPYDGLREGALITVVA